MADQQHLSLLRQGTFFWNQWRNSSSNVDRVDLRAADLTGADLSEANLRSADLTGADLSEANLRDADFFLTTVSGVDFSGADLRGISFIAEDFAGVNFSGANLSGLNLQTSFLLSANISKANLSRTNLTDMDLSERDLQGLDLSGATLCKANLLGTDLACANLTGADLREAQISEASVSDIGIEDLDFDERVEFENRRANRKRTNLSKANLSGADLSGLNLNRVNLSGANLSGANLSGANLSEADFSGATLKGANLTRAILVKTNLENANLTDCSIHGISVWDVQLKEAIQSNLIITDKDEPTLAVDNLEIAQFIYLLLEHKKLRDVLNSVMERGVLLLGRFRDGGIELLQLIATKLRDEKYIPMIFDFDRPSNRDYTETVKTLVGLSRFVIVDLSGPSVPQELYATTPHFDIPFVPIIEEGRKPHSMFRDFLKYPWVLPPVEFASEEQLMGLLPSRVIAPAEEKCKERQAQLKQLFNQ